MPKDRDAYELEPNDHRRSVLAMAIEGSLITEGAMVLRGDGDDDGYAFRLEEPFQAAYRDLNRARLLVGTTYTGRGYRAATDWGLIT
jgi:hypothetical protein